LTLGGNVGGNILQISSPFRPTSPGPASHAGLAISSASAKALDFIQPQLATSVDHPPPRAGWIHEVKHDGYRTLLIVERHKARAYTRNGFDWTDRYPAITKAAAKLDCRSAIIDGEVIVQNEQGISDFDALKASIRWHPQKLILCAFDLLHLNAKDLRNGPLLERRARLKELIPTEHPFLFSEEFTGDAAAFFRACADHQLEGLFPNLPRQNTGVDAARLGLRRNALPKTHS
jgi:bifunctional non-homologous end joining protein LigD